MDSILEAFVQLTLFRPLGIGIHSFIPWFPCLLSLFFLCEFENLCRELRSCRLTLQSVPNMTSHSRPYEDKDARTPPEPMWKRSSLKRRPRGLSKPGLRVSVKRSFYEGKWFLIMILERANTENLSYGREICKSSQI